ncbi:MAG: hypothetical protein FJZ92_00630 [Chloroflexi bacterium]|nr:hypothetical protein [Chloroflexota bacterium]
MLVTRQPIDNARLEVTAYELLFRSLSRDALSGDVGTRATARLIVDSLMEQGTQVLTEGHPAHVNFTRDLTVEGYAHAIPPRSVVIEVLEDVPPDAEVLESLRRLRQAFDRIALDDVHETARAEAFAAVATAVKVDLPYVDVKDLPGW